MHGALNDTLYKCLQHKRWLLVAELEDFVLSAPMRKEVTEIDLRIRIVNISIGLKFAGKDAEATRLLDSVDWSASYRDFKLAIAVLHEKYDEAIALMKSIGRTGEILIQHSYHTWPLFTRFRERPEFYEAYFHIYGEAFSEKVDTSKGSVEAQARSPDIIEPSLTVEGSVIDGTAHKVSSTSRGKKRPSAVAAKMQTKTKATRKPNSSKSAVPVMRRKKAAQQL
jgi:hypothetical protein